jgi:hypothetical protein
MEEDVKLLKRRRIRPDQFGVRQLLWTAAIILVFFVLAANARWKDVTWRRTTATVISAVEMCAHHWRRPGQKTLFLETEKTLPCSDIEGNLRVKAKHATNRHYQMSTFFNATVAYVDNNGYDVQSRIWVGPSVRPRPHPSKISEDRRKLGLVTDLVQPGDRYEIAHSRVWSSRADLAHRVKRGRVAWLVVFLIVIVFIGFIFFFEILPESQKEFDEIRENRYRGPIAPPPWL